MRINDSSISMAHRIKADVSDTKVIKLRVAELNIELSCLYGNAFFSLDDYVNSYDQSDIHIQITNQDLEKEHELHPEFESPEIIVENGNTSITYNYGCFEPHVVLKKLADVSANYGAVLFHGSVISLNNRGYMFAAPSGIGKTTRTKIWLEQYPTSFVVNGDKPFIRIRGDQVLAYGTPWCGKEGWNTNTMVPLRAIFLLERAEEGEESSIEEVNLGKAFPFLLQQTHRPEDPSLMRKTLQLLKSLEGKVKIYRFRSTPTGDSVRLAYETARPR